jgi:hypothetical protein
LIARLEAGLARYLRSFALRLGTEIGFGTRWDTVAARSGGTHWVLAEGGTVLVAARARQPGPDASIRTGRTA